MGSQPGCVLPGVEDAIAEGFRKEQFECLPRVTAPGTLSGNSSHDRSLCLEGDRRCTEIISVIPSMWLGYIPRGRSLWGQMARGARPVSELRRPSLKKRHGP